MECRRSSRKKVTKFDVRDLLNKSRKPHKIQIEARIDAADASCSGSNVEKSQSTLENKQKTFMEKSAIFRRYSISEQQSKMVTTPIRHMLPPANLSIIDKNTNEPAGSGGLVQRLRTQEIFNASMMKSKQNSSLIVTQMESNANVQLATHTKKMKNSPKATAVKAAGDGGGVVQKRRGRPPKVKPVEQIPILEKDAYDDTSKSCTSTNATYTNVPTQNMRELFVPISKECKSESDAGANVDQVLLEMYAPPDELATVQTFMPAETVPRSVDGDFVQVPCTDDSKVSVSAIDSTQLSFSGIEEIVIESNVTTTDDISDTANPHGNIFVVEATGNAFSDDVQCVERIANTSSSSDAEVYSVLERSSGSSGGKIYQEGDELRVKLKRLNIPTDQVAATTVAAVGAEINECLFSKGDVSKQLSDVACQQTTATTTISTECRPKSKTEIASTTVNVRAVEVKEVNAELCDERNANVGNEKLNVTAMTDQRNKEQLQSDRNIAPMQASVPDAVAPSSTDKCPNALSASKSKDLSFLPTSSTYKKTITLPLKKHVSKFKHFEINTDPPNVTAPSANATAFVSEPSFMKNVNVETSTLLDILRTVESNKIVQQFNNEHGNSKGTATENVKATYAETFDKSKERNEDNMACALSKLYDIDDADNSTDTNTVPNKLLLNDFDNELRLKCDVTAAIAEDANLNAGNTTETDTNAPLHNYKLIKSENVSTTTQTQYINAIDATTAIDNAINPSISNRRTEIVKAQTEAIDINNQLEQNVVNVNKVQSHVQHSSTKNSFTEELKQPKPPPKKRISKMQPPIQDKQLEQFNVASSADESVEKITSIANRSDVIATLAINASPTSAVKNVQKEEKMIASAEESNDTCKSHEAKCETSEGNETKVLQCVADIASDKEATLTSASTKSRNVECTDAAANESNKSLDDKTAKKRRHRKLKEAFAAALLDVKMQQQINAAHTTAASGIAEQAERVPKAAEKSIEMPEHSTAATKHALTADEATATHKADKASATLKSDKHDHVEEQSDPLKDIEKFIEAGVNLLNRSYKHDNKNDDDKKSEPPPVGDSVSEQQQSSVSAVQQQIESEVRNENLCDETLKRKLQLIEDGKDSATTTLTSNSKREELSSPLPLPHTDTDIVNEMTFNLFETPADTPINTPSATPPPKSPVREEEFSSSSIAAGQSDETALRRSHRIKQITKTPKALVGRGLVRDKERISLKDDVETKSHYSLDDHLLDLAEVEAKNAKFLKEMEERLSNFQVIKENEYKCERIISKEARRMICDCFLTADEEERGELGCGEDCLNRLLMIECGPDCNVKERCTNRRFQRFLCSPCRVFRTEKKGFGIMADIEILPGEFIMEYVGEVIDDEDFERRRTLYSQEKNRHYYFMALRSDAIIDATIKGNISRFINHSCDPNAETQKWTVNGELRIGFFSRKSIMPGEEITFDYQYQRYGREAQRCYCESSNCRGWIGEEPNSDEGEGEQVDEESDDDNLADSLLDDDDDDEESDDSADVDAEKKLQLAAAEAKLFPLGHKGETAATARERARGGRKGADDDGQDPKNKLKHLLSRVAEKVAKKKKEQKKRLQKEQKQKQRHGKDGAAGAALRHLEDPDIEDEVNFLSRCGVKNQSDTLRMSRLMVRAKLPQTRLNLLQVLRRGELPCRRLFLDYHGLRLLHGWMSEDGGDVQMRLALLETLTCLPIANKTVLTDTKVYHTVRNWSNAANASSVTTTAAASPAPTPTPTHAVDESSKESSTSNNDTPTAATAASGADVAQTVLEITTKLLATWDSLPDIFRIPKRERIEQMKEHEREADRQYAAAADGDESAEHASKTSSIDRYQRDRFGRMGSGASRYNTKPYSKETRTITTITSANVPSDPRRRLGMDGNGASTLDSSTRHLSKEQRREMFAAKVARDEAEKRFAEERRDFETKCRFFGLDPKKTRPQDMPFCVVPTTGQWYSADRQPILTPPSYAHVQVPVKAKSTNPNDYQLPGVVNMLPKNWRYAITPQGHIYYYHIKYRVPQWEVPNAASNNSGTPSDSETDDDTEGGGGDERDESSDEPSDDELFMSMDKAKLSAYIESKVFMRRAKRYKRLVAERGISPRREEDRVYNQMEVRKYKENKEKIRKRKEEIRRRRAEAQRALVLEALDDDATNNTASTSKDAVAAIKQEAHGDAEEEQQTVAALPIQDYLLSSSDEGEVESIKEECNNSPLLEKIVQGDKIVDELDALANNRPLKRLLLTTHREQFGSNGSGSGSSGSNAHELKKRKLEKKEKSGSTKSKSKESDAKYRKLKEKFRCEIAGIIVGNLKPYRKDTCQIARIQSDQDFNHLARKLTHFVMIKELKYCESVGQTLVVTESVKNKSREFIKKYMAKYGSVYEKPQNDPEFKDIPFCL